MVLAECISSNKSVKTQVYVQMNPYMQVHKLQSGDSNVRKVALLIYSIQLSRDIVNKYINKSMSSS